MSKKITNIVLLSIAVFLCLSTAALAQKDHSGPVISSQSTVYQVGNKWYCPLCRKEVPNADRSNWDLRLQLSEWHDVLIEKEYFDKKIRHISDEELVNSLNIKSINKDLKDAIKEKNYNRVSEILHDYFSNRKDNQRLSIYDYVNKKFFCTTDIFVNDVNADTSRYNRIIRSKNLFYNSEKGYTIANENIGKKIDFNYNYKASSKHGIHGLSVLDDMIEYYVLKKDPETPKIIEDFFNQWYDQIDNIKAEKVINQPKSYDYIWYELGIAVRQQRMIDGLRVFVKELSPETTKRFLKIILGNARWLDQCLTKTPFHPYNWQTHSSMSLSFTACAFPEFKESDTWYKKTKHNIILHLNNDIFDDGGYVERTPGYAEYMYSVYYSYMLMLKYFKNDTEIMDKYLGRIEKAIQFFVLTTTPVGTCAPFNDAHRNKNLVKVFQEMGEFFKRGDFIGAVKNNIAPDVLASLKVKPEEPKIRSIDFPNSHFIVMRESWNPKSFFMITNYGEFQNHSHYDQLAFEAFANGVPIAVDAGLGKLGYIDTLHVLWYKHPIAHNMLTINQAIPEKMDKCGYDKIWAPQKYTEYFAASHDGYMKYQKTKHRRHIIYSNNRYWLIVDEVFTKEKEKDMDFNLHTPCDMIEITNGFISKQENGFIILSDNSDAANITKMKKSGGADLGGLDNEPAHRDIDWLIFRKETKGDSKSDRLATLIYPFESKKNIDQNNISVEKIELGDKNCLGYKVKSGSREDVIILSDGKYRKFTKSIEGDFKYGFFSYENGKLVKSSLSGVKKIKVDDIKKVLLKTADIEF